MPDHCKASAWHLCSLGAVKADPKELVRDHFDHAFAQTSSKSSSVQEYSVMPSTRTQAVTFFETLTFATSGSGDFFSLTSDIPAEGGEFIFLPAVFLPDGYISGTEL